MLGERHADFTPQPYSLPQVSRELYISPMLSQDGQQRTDVISRVYSGV